MWFYKCRESSDLKKYSDEKEIFYTLTYYLALLRDLVYIITIDQIPNIMWTKLQSSSSG
jgi:hypothetical protein